MQRRKSNYWCTLVATPLPVSPSFYSTALLNKPHAVLDTGSTHVVLLPCSRLCVRWRYMGHASTAVCFVLAVSNAGIGEPSWSGGQVAPQSSHTCFVPSNNQ